MQFGLSLFLLMALAWSPMVQEPVIPTLAETNVVATQEMDDAAAPEIDTQDSASDQSNAPAPEEAAADETPAPVPATAPMPMQESVLMGSGCGCQPPTVMASPCTPVVASTNIGCCQPICCETRCCKPRQCCKFRVRRCRTRRCRR